MTKEHKTGIGRAVDYLYPRDVSPDHLNRLFERGTHAFEVWVREATSFRRDPAEILHAWADDKEKESAFKHTVEGFEFIGHMDIADRASNGLRVALLYDNMERSQPSQFGQMLHRAYNV